MNGAEPLAARSLQAAIEALATTGFAVVENVLDRELLARTREAMYLTQEGIIRDIGRERLTRAGELTVLRLMMQYDPLFYEFLEIPALLQVVDAVVSSTAILHLQNGFILPSLLPEQTPRVFQNAFHQDFPRVLNGYVASMNVMFAVDGFNRENGGTLMVPRTHQQVQRPSEAYMEAHAVPICCPPGAMILFDSTLYHAAGRNISGGDRLSINHQFTRSFIKQQIDYVRAIGTAQLSGLAPRTQQLLGGYTRVVTSLDEYYQPEESRLYRRGQG